MNAVVLTVFDKMCAVFFFLIKSQCKKNKEKKKKGENPFGNCLGFDSLKRSAMTNIFHTER